MNKNNRYIHCIGIGGIGISALARWYQKDGYILSGSDSTESELIQDLRDSGMNIWTGNNANNIPVNVEMVIYTEAIITKPDIDPTLQLESHPELSWAMKNNIPVYSYPEALGKLTKEIPTIAVTGTHGKSTTTSMIGVATKHGQVLGSTIVGTLVPDFGNSNLHFGGKELLNIEACEYKRSFLKYTPEIMIVTNIELDHLDYYKDLEDYISAFRSLQEQTKGIVVLNALDSGCQSMKDTSISQAWVYPNRYELRIPNEENKVLPIPKMKLQVPGDHIYIDACLAYCALHLQTELSPKQLQLGLESYKSSWRRMEKIGITQNKNILISDYGHHPSEIQPTLAAIKESYPGKKMIVAFQPHQYSRTIELLDGFMESFESADVVLIPNIYFSRDSKADVESMPIELFVSKVQEKHSSTYNTHSLEGTFERFQEYDKKEQDTYVFVLMGAGDIDTIRYMDWNIQD